MQDIDIQSYLSTNTPLVDVRSPGEFAKGHIPGATNIPLFSDDERAQVGTAYVQKSQEKAIELGYQFVNPKLSDFIGQSRKVAPDGKVAIHCWRGGMRSHAFAEHLHKNGFQNISVITGGYKAYRNHLLSTFEKPFDLRIVGGYTGSGKTLVIHQLQRVGLQAVDLEGLAKHKGSAFGAIANQIQPSVEQFENDLFEVWRKLEDAQPIWLEDESHNIGGVNLPIHLFHQMRNAPMYFLDIPKEARAQHLVADYANADVEVLAESLGRIAKRLDGQKTKEAFQCLREHRFYEVAFLALSYYDKSYLKGMRFRNQANIVTIATTDTNPIKNTESILQFYHERYKTHPV